MSRYASAEIRFNLLALIKNREDVYKTRIGEIEERISNINNSTELMQLNEEREQLSLKIEMEKDKFKRYERENSLRKHNFIQFIYNIIRILAERGELQARIEYARKEMSKRIKDRAEKKRETSGSKK
jgi:ubiquitin carboxyl-terminal hydrolase L5